MSRPVPVLLALLALGFLGLGSCTGGRGPDHQRAVDGSVLLEEVSGSQVGDRLSVTGLDGHRGEIDIPGPAIGLATRLPGKAIYTTIGGSVYLVDADRGSATRLDIPPHAGVIFNPILFGQSDRFLVLGSPRGDAGYLVDLETGRATNLIGRAGATKVFSSEFAPDGRHLAFFGDELVLLSTTDPASATRLGPAHGIGFAGFSADGDRVAYIDVSDPSHPKLVVQGVDGSNRTSADLPAGTVRAHILGAGGRAVLEQSDRLSLLNVGTGHVSELMSFQGTPRLSWFGPDGNTMLFGAEAAGHVTWAWLDLARGTSRELGVLRNQQPLLNAPSDRFVFFADGQVPGTVRSLRVLDMADGGTKQVFDFGNGGEVPGYQIASGGRSALIPTDQGKGGELRVVPAQGGQPRIVASSQRGLPLGTFLEYDPSVPKLFDGRLHVGTPDQEPGPGHPPGVAACVIGFGPD